MAENKIVKNETLFLTKKLPQLTKNLFIKWRLFSFPRYVGLGTNIKIAGINNKLNTKETTIPNDTINPTSLTLDNSWLIKLRKLITVVIPARKIGMPSLFIVRFRISTLLNS